MWRAIESRQRRLILKYKQTEVRLRWYFEFKNYYYDYYCFDSNWNLSWKFEENVTFFRRKKGIKDVKLIVTLEYPVKITSSPSSRNFLSNPFKESEFCPFHVNSSKHPRASGS
jgi:hypothetical protein